MAADLEERERQSRDDDVPSRGSDAMPERWDGILHSGKAVGQCGEEDAIGRHKPKLYERQGCGLREGDQDSFRGRVRQRRREIPDYAERLRSSSACSVRFGDGNWRPTISFGETGAFSAPAISWAFALTLPLRERMVRNASVKLFCLPWLLPKG